MKLHQSTFGATRDARPDRVADPVPAPLSRVAAAQDTLLILSAPNVSEQMGGEAIKALQIFQELRKIHPQTIQITHGRNRAEIERLGLDDVRFIDDTWLALLLWRSVVLRNLLDVWYSAKAVRLAERLAAQAPGAESPTRVVVIHQTEPNSPVLPRALSKRHVNVLGPINGNIYYPPVFRAYERPKARLRRLLHMPLQRLNRLLPGGIRKAELILVAGGDRTAESLRAAGCRDAILQPSLDCGVRDALLERPRATQVGFNPRFIHFGRLVFHKGTALIIESLAKTRLPICLDIVGRGPTLESCRALVRDLRLDDRVRFLGWYTAQDDLFESFGGYRGVVLPSLEDANGLAIQEAMALGLPPVCLDWGGPSLLVEHGRSGFLVEPVSIEHITSGLAACLDRLAEDGELAESMSIAARGAAEGWRWSNLARRWLASYPRAAR